MTLIIVQALCSINRGCATGQCSFRCRSPCRHLMTPNQFAAHPADTMVEQTRWSTLDGCHLDEDDVIEAVHKVVGGPVSNTVGQRFNDYQNSCNGNSLRPLRYSNCLVRKHKNAIGLQKKMRKTP